MPNIMNKNVKLDYPTWCPYCAINSSSIFIQVSGQLHLPAEIGISTLLVSELRVARRCESCGKEYRIVVELRTHIEETELELLPNGRFKPVSVSRKLADDEPKAIARIYEEAV